MWCLINLTKKIGAFCSNLISMFTIYTQFGYYTGIPYQQYASCVCSNRSNRSRHIFEIYKIFNFFNQSFGNTNVYWSKEK